MIKIVAIRIDSRKPLSAALTSYPASRSGLLLNFTLLFFTGKIHRNDATVVRSLKRGMRVCD